MTMDDKKKKTAANAPAKRTRKWSLARKCLAWSGAAVAVLLLLSLIGAWLIFSGYREFPAPDPGRPHYLFLRDIASQLRNNRRKKEATIRLSPQEVDLLLDIVRHSSQFVRSRNEVPPPEFFMLEYRRDGALGFSVPINVTGSWCFGGKIYVSGDLYFEKRGRQIDADLPKLRIGRFGLPIGGIGTYVPGWKAKLEKALASEYMDAIKSIGSESDGTLVLVYSPEELRNPLKRHLTKVRERCSNDLRPWITQVIQAL